MAQTGNAQREPSMEEILASIRRIIQDSDTTQEPAAGASGPDVVVEAPAVEIGRPDEPGLREVEAFRAELDEPAPAASYAAGIADAEPEVRAAPFLPAAEVHALHAPAIDEVEPEPAPQPADEPQAEAHSAADEQPVGRAPAFPAVAAPAVEAAEPRPAIISDRAGRQVAAAFGELSEAFAASRRRSFDDMAQEMLRPMLQEWLDDNLPTLVERLVREEIERVARGG